MNPKSLLEKEVVLATGAKMMLLEAAMALLCIEEMLSGGPGNRAEFAAIRRASLMGSSVPTSFALSEEALVGVVGSDRHVLPVVRQVILAAVRGEEDNLYLVNPYTDERDRIMSDLLNNSTKASLFLSSEQTQQFLAEPADGLGEWVRLVKKGNGPGRGGCPPPSSN